MSDRILTSELGDGILVATINRPEKGNALDTPTVDALDALLDRLADPDDELGAVRALILTGAGERAFSAGADIGTLRGLGADEARDQMRHGQRVFGRLEGVPQVTIAAIRGVAYGGGLEVAMACDLRVAHPDARLGQPEITLANLPGWGGTQRLPRLIGRGRALEMILTGDPIGAARALDLGLVNAVADDPVRAAADLARRIVRHAPGAVAAAKEAVYAGERDGIVAGLVREAELVGLRCVTPEQRAAVDAFINRKKN